MWYTFKMTKEKILEKIVSEMINARLKTRKDLDYFKRQMAKKYQTQMPKNWHLLQAYHKLTKNKNKNQCLDIRYLNIEKLLVVKPVRSLSGIVNVSVLTKPYPCPGKCIFCPKEKGIPKSYLSQEPAVQRALSNNFHPYGQVQSRLQALASSGHPIDKIELRIIGGTWSFYPRTYQTWFIKQCFQSANNFPFPKTNVLRSHLKTLDLKTLQTRNEKAKAKIIGITVETRPDYLNFEEVKRMRQLGVTRVELGAQTIYNDILKLNKRGHTVEQTIQATKLLRDNSFKVSFQIMLNLLGSTFKKDLAMFKVLFSNPSFMPDTLKIYPLALIKTTPIYKLYKQGKYKPYSEKQLIKLLIAIKKQIPRWVRVERVIRDIPSGQIVTGGSKVLNLREIVQKTMEKQKEKCLCIRCREVKDFDKKEKLHLFQENYSASGGQEIFLSFENKPRTRLYALLRLRLSNQCLEVGPLNIGLLAVLRGAALIRELHTFGPAMPIKKIKGQTSDSVQHKGLGKKLIKEAEKIAKQNGFKKIAVIAGIGSRGYYRKLDYKLKNTYLIKKLN